MEKKLTINVLFLFDGVEWEVEATSSLTPSVAIPMLGGCT